MEEAVKASSCIQQLFVDVGCTSVRKSALLAASGRNCIEVADTVLLVYQVEQARLHVALIQHLLLLSLQLLQKCQLLCGRTIAAQICFSRVPVRLAVSCVLRRACEVQRHVTVLHGAALRTAPIVHVSVTGQF